MAAIDAMPNFTEAGLINFVKVRNLFLSLQRVTRQQIRRMAHAVRSYKQHQFESYALEPVFPLVHFLLFKLQVIADATALYQLSLHNEPRVNK